MYISSEQMARIFTKPFPNRLHTSINPGSNDEGDGEGNVNEPNIK